MDYRKNYEDFINSRRSRKLEKDFEIHHILPKSMGGKDEKENLIQLTYREHYLAHYMLYKIYGNIQMLKALYIMSKNSRHLNNKFSSRNYEKLKKEYIKAISIPVICLETGEIFPSKTAAAIACGKTKYGGQDINNAIKKGIKAGGYHWKLFEEGKDYSNFQIENFSIIREDGETYNSWKEASEKNNCSVGEISYCLRTGKTLNGFKIRKANEKFVERKQNGKIVCLETGEIFPNKHQALVSLEKAGFRLEIDIRTNIGKAYGYHWSWYEEGKDYSKTKFFGKPRMSKMIICEETQEIFSSAKEVREQKGFGIENALSGRVKVCHSLHWRYLTFEEAKNFFT